MYPQTFAGYIVPVAINGSRGISTNYVLDNGDNNDSFSNVSLPFPNPDAVQEFSIQASTFDAQYGRGVGGVVNVVTRSGTNQLHGSMFEYLRNYELNAANFFSGRDTVKRNQFGFSAGGPVTCRSSTTAKTRHSIFGSYQGTRQRTATPGAGEVTPSQAMKNGDFSEWLKADGTGAVRDPLALNQVFPGNIIPFEPLRSRRAQASRLHARVSAGQQLTSCASTRPKVTNNDDQFVAGSIIKSPSSSAFRSALSLSGSTVPGRFLPSNIYFVTAGQKGYSQNSTLNHSYVISAKWVNDFNYTMNGTESNSFPPTRLPTSRCKGWARGSKCCPTSPYMMLTINGWTGVNLGQGFTQYQKEPPVYRRDQLRHRAAQFQSRLRLPALCHREDRALSERRDRRLYRPVVEQRRQTERRQRVCRIRARAICRAWRQRSSWSEYLTNNYLALFAQEDIRLTSRLTANLGLRWDPRIDFHEDRRQADDVHPGHAEPALPQCLPGPPVPRAIPTSRMR